MKRKNEDKQDITKPIFKRLIIRKIYVLRFILLGLYVGLYFGLIFFAATYLLLFAVSQMIETLNSSLIDYGISFSFLDSTSILPLSLLVGFAILVLTPFIFLSFAGLYNFFAKIGGAIHFHAQIKEE